MWRWIWCLFKRPVFMFGNYQISFSIQKNHESTGDRLHSPTGAPQTRLGSRSQQHGSCSDSPDIFNLWWKKHTPFISSACCGISRSATPRLCGLYPEWKSTDTQDRREFIWLYVSACVSVSFWGGGHLLFSPYFLCEKLCHPFLSVISNVGIRKTKVCINLITDIRNKEPT